MKNNNKTSSLLKIENLQTWFGKRDNPVRAVDGVSFEIQKGETFALLGESGCGKSITSLSIMRLVPEPAGKIVGGKVLLHDKDLLQLPEVVMRDVRGRRIAMIFQEPMTSLNPVMTIGNQIQETVLRHGRIRRSGVDKRVLELLDAVGIPDPKRRVNEYPHQLSGGMKQRVMIAMALAGEPELLIADEPTTALDVTIQSQVLELIRSLQRDTGMAILLITHDLGVVAEVADRVAVMYAGQIVEQADRETFFSSARHPYSRKLFDSVPTLDKRGQALAVIKGSVPSLSTKFSGCRFESRCEYAWEECRAVVPEWTEAGERMGVLCHLWSPANADKAQTLSQTSTQSLHSREKTITNTSEEKPLLHVENLKVHFPVTKGLFKRTVGHVKAVDGVSLRIPQGQTLALVGESGCGKTTVGKGILQLVKPTGGIVQLGELSLTKLSSSEIREARADIQIIFQDPFSSMNPRMMISDIIEEGMIAQGIGGSEEERSKRVDELLSQVGLSAEIKRRYPHEFSGGQRQRICIARALAVEPKLIICDEPTSALDVSVQAQILNLLKGLQDKLGLTFLFITHDLSVVEYLAHEVAVMYLGRIVEQGNVEEVLQNPMHPYTKALLSAVPTIEQDPERKIIRLRGEIPSPINPPIGCHFNPRCAHAIQVCRNKYPEPTKISDTHFVRCVLFE